MAERPEGFEAMGRPIPEDRREAAYQALKDMAPDASNSERWSLLERVADHLERDQPYKALREATTAPPPGTPQSTETGDRMPYTGQPGLRIDYTGALRLMAHLLAG